jgi:hypothetical protein
MKRLITLAFLIGALPLTILAQTGVANSAAKSTLDDLLKLVPDDAALVAVVPDLEELVGGIQGFGATLGINDLIGLDADTLLDGLGIAELSSEWCEHLRKDGPFVFVLTEPNADPLLICTIVEPADLPTSELTRLKGDVLIVAPDAGVMQAAKEVDGKFAPRFESRARKTLEGHHLALFLDLPSWATEIEQFLSLGEMFSQMGAAATTSQPQVNLTMVNWLFQALRTGFEEGETLAIAARINADGLHFSKLMHFDPTGTVAQYLSKVRKPGKDLLRGLAAKRGTMIIAGEWDLPPETETISEQMLKVMLAGATEQPGTDEAESKESMRRALRLYRVIAGYNGVVSFGGEPSGLSATGLYLTDQPQVLLDGFPALWKLSAPMMSSMAPGFSMETTDETETVGSVKAQVYRMKFDAENEEFRKALTRIYGESTTFYAAPHPEGVAYTMGSAKVARKNLEQLLANKTASLGSDPHVVSALKNFSPNPQMFALIDLPDLLRWGLEFAEAPAPPLPPATQPTEPLPYAGLALYLHEASCGAELFLPGKALKVFVDLAEGPAGDPTGTDSY